MGKMGSSKKILHINLLDNGGGAAIAAYRLHSAMLEHGLDSQMLVIGKSRDDESVKTFYHNKAGMVFYKIKSYVLGEWNYIKKNNSSYSTFWIGSPIKSLNIINDADVIYLHWICKGVLNYRNISSLLKKGKKVIWVMHDMFPVTGGCHHAMGCERYKLECTDCPFWSRHSRKASRQFLNKKRLVLEDNMYWVAPSKWLYNLSCQSPAINNERLFRIPNIINNSFHPIETRQSRDELGLEQNVKYILYGADGVINNPYKGLRYFVETLSILNQMISDEAITYEIKVLIFGASENEELKLKIPFETIFLGVIRDEKKMNSVYNAADLMVITSTAENYPLTVQESVCAGTSVAGFDVGGISDIVDCEEKGELVKPYDTNSLAEIVKKRIENGVGKIVSHYDTERDDILNKHLRLIFDE